MPLTYREHPEFWCHEGESRRREGYPEGGRDHEGERWRENHQYEERL